MTTLGSSTSESEQPGDFILFGNPSIYDTAYRSFSHPNSNIFPSVVADVTFPDILGDSNLSVNDLPQSNMTKEYYSLGTSSLEAELPVTSSAPGYEDGPFPSTEAPRNFYMDESLASTPGLLIHPPTIPFHHSQYTPQGDYRSTSASPTTTVGGFEGSGSGLSGSEPGSTRNSPYNPPIGVEEHLQSFAMMDPGVAFNGIDPSLVSISTPVERPMSAASPYGGSPNWSAMHSPPQIPSNPGSPDFPRYPNQSGRLSPAGHQPYCRHVPYPQRRPSTASVHSRGSMGSPNMNTVDHEDMYTGSRETVGFMPSRSPSQKSNGSTRRSPDSTNGGGKDGKETLCSECNKSFRDLRAHQLTHMLERPEKCPIATCEYSKKGFARKYDCQRHTLTHYKGTMVCGFCPGSGSAMEKSFNRADVFKRHLMAVHNVEQQPPNGRQKKLPAKGKESQTGDFATDEYRSGKCSTCGITFATAQQFYEHLDDCVLSKVVEEEPHAAANERNLSQIKLEEVDEDYVLVEEDEEDDDFGEIEEMEDDEEKDATYVGTSSSKKRRAQGTRSKGKALKRSGSGNSR